MFGPLLGHEAGLEFIERLSFTNRTRNLHVGRVTIELAAERETILRYAISRPFG